MNSGWCRVPRIEGSPTLPTGDHNRFSASNITPESLRIIRLLTMDLTTYDGALLVWAESVRRVYEIGIEVKE